MYAGPQRLHDSWRHDKNELCFLIAKSGCAKERANNRKVSEKRDLAEVFENPAIEKAANNEGLPFTHFDAIHASTHAQPRDHDAAKRDRDRRIDITDFRKYPQINRIRPRDSWHKVQSYPERFELDSDIILGGKGNWEFASGQKPARLSVFHHHARLSQNLGNGFILKQAVDGRERHIACHIRQHGRRATAKKRRRWKLAGILKKWTGRESSLCP